MKSEACRLFQRQPWRWTLSDNLIMASPHCNGWNRPAELQGGVDRPLTEIAPRAGRKLDGRGPPREREKVKTERLSKSLLHTTDCQSEPLLPQNTELQNAVIGRAECRHLCFLLKVRRCSQSWHRYMLQFSKSQFYRTHSYELKIVNTVKSIKPTEQTDI